MTARVFWLAVVVVALLGAALRLNDLAAPSLWADELFQLRDALYLTPQTALDFFGYVPTRLGLMAAGVPTDEIIARTEIFPSIDCVRECGYATLQADGVTEWNARIGTALVAILGIPLLIWVCASFMGMEVALLMGLLLALSTWHLDWSQNARFYSPMFLVYNLSLVLYFAASRRGSHWQMVLAMALAITAVWTKATSLMIFGIIGIDWLFELWRTRRLPLTPAGVAIVASGALICFGSLFLGGSASAFEEYVEEMGSNRSPVRVMAQHVYRAGVPIMILAALGIVEIWRDPDRRRLAAFLSAAAFVPLVCFGALSFITRVHVRYTFVAHFAFVALAGIGLHRLCLGYLRSQPIWVRWAPALLVVGSLLVTDLAYYEPGYGYRPRFRDAFAYVARNRQPDDLVYSLNVWGAHYYLEDADVEAVPGDVRSLEQLDIPADRDAWIVVKTTSYELDSGRKHWLDGKAELRAFYSTRVPYPQSTLRVYFREAG